MTKSRIAVLISLLLAAPAGVVALEQSASTASVEGAPPAEQATAPGAVYTETTTVAVVPAETVAVTPTDTVVTPAETAAPPAPAKKRSWFGSLFSRADSGNSGIYNPDAGTAFPQGSRDSEGINRLLPRQAAYLDRLEQQRASSMMAMNGSSFPQGSYSEPFEAAQMASVMRAEETRIAQRNAEQARLAQQQREVAPRTSAESAQAGSAEVAMADSSSIR